MAQALRVLPFLVTLFIRSRLQYRGAVILGWVSQAFAYGTTYTAIALIITRFDNLGGWHWPEMALLLSFHLLAYATGASFSFTQMRDLEQIVHQGKFDALLVKPMSPWAYLVFSGLNIGYTGHIILALGLMAWSLTQVAVSWSPLTALYFLTALLSSAMLVAALITMIGASALIWVRSKYLYSIFFGFWELARFPLNIYPGVVQAVMLTVMPLGFLTYVPVAVLLGKDVVLLGSWAGAASLLSGPIAVLIAMAHWRYCIRHYQGAGG
jgi:ABC-2 type transport system permease protein